MNLGILSLDWTTLIQLINFGILIFFMKKFLYKPVTEMFAMREKEIQDNYENAKKAEEEANKLQLEYTEKMKSARLEAKDIVASATVTAKQKADIMVEDARVKAQKREEEANINIASEKKKAFSELKTEISDIALTIASKVIEKDFNTADNDKLINQFIDGVGEEEWQK